MNHSTTKELSFTQELHACDLIILAAGFEDRAFHFLKNSKFNKDAYCILIKYSNIGDPDFAIFNKFFKKAKKAFNPDRIQVVQLLEKGISQFEGDLNESLFKISRSINDVWIDISGMPTYAICITLNSVRTIFSNKSQSVVYSAAAEYFPQYSEYQKISSHSKKNEEYIPKTMAMEMSELLILETFSGHRSKEGISCLAIFAGYDSSRTGGVIESINPSMLLLLYGDPGGTSLEWRLELSKLLHRKFESTRKTAVETVSTLNINQSINVLEEYYRFLFEDYDFTIAPICSKMQVVGTFLFWERYREVQLVFPLPIGYATENKPTGISKTYITTLEPRNSLYRDFHI